MTWEALGITVNGHTSGQHAVQCPRCSASRTKARVPCLSINLDEGLYNCHHCGWAGGLKQGDITSSGLSSLPKVYRKPTYPPPPPPAPTLEEWFRKRGIPRRVIERRHVSTTMIYMPQHEGEERAIQFPYFRHGECVNIKYRDAHKHFRMVSGAERILYGLDDIRGDSVVICEGECDAMAIEVAGYPSVVSVPDGAPAVATKNYASKFDFLETCEADLAGLRTIVIAVDNDAPGNLLAAELARRLGPERCVWASWPDGCKDANDVLVRDGARALSDCLDHAQPWPVSGIGTGKTLKTGIEAMYDNAPPRGLSTGWLELDRYYTVRPGELTIVSGIPSHGKSAFVSALAINMAKIHDWNFTIFSPENAPMERYAAALISLYVGKRFWGESRMSRNEMHEGRDWLSDHVTFLMPEDATPTVDWLLDLAKIQVYRQGIKGLILDPWNEVDFHRPANRSETDHISMSLSQIKRFAMLHGVHVWVIAHPTKLRKAESGKYAGQYPPPTPYDIAGSANFRNKADNCITIWRDVDVDDNRVNVFVQKVRFLTVGKPGESILIYQPDSGRFIEPWMETVA